MYIYIYITIQAFPRRSAWRKKLRSALRLAPNIVAVNIAYNYYSII